ncbi:DUF423 domain-containing protein [Aureispira anguillae]|uniref:DUF423 domain-containing protein n=1 Tax=Aureispira anguillae TaxID=2864201 RepID=A0A915YG73_9BACT|nr:DUF423 domain-containing protein [Aureispira anguillae]BDS12457.1 DUF423 domain-containing protein [Aureispira anguillae]
MQKKLLITTGILGCLAVILGAFGAHALAEKLSSSQLNTYQTGIQYHYYHTLALLGVLAIRNQYTTATWLYRAAFCFIVGILFFSGSIYLLACQELLSLQKWVKIIGPITPIGGLFFILGWLMLIIQAIQFPNTEQK